MRTSTPETVATGNGKKHLYAARNIPFLTIGLGDSGQEGIPIRLITRAVGVP